MSESKELAVIPAAELDETEKALAALSEAHRHAFAILREACLVIDELVDEEPDNLEGQARAEIIVEVIRRDLASVQDKAKRNIAEHGPRQKQFTVDGVGVYERCNKGAKDAWDDEAAIRAVLSIAGQEQGDDESPSAAVLRVLQECARFNWRSTPFTKRGIDIDDEEIRDRVAGESSVRRVSGGPR